MKFKIYYRWDVPPVVRCHEFTVGSLDLKALVLRIAEARGFYLGEDKSTFIPGHEIVRIESSCQRS